MRFRNIALASVALILVAIVAPLAISQEKSDAKAAAPAGIDPKMMEEMMKAAAPGPQHEMLKKLEGKFAADVSFRMAPDQDEQKSKGEETNKMIMNGRFLQSEYSGDMMGQPFKGLSTTGYDNMKKKFCNSWIDDMGTGMMVSEGAADASGKTITFSGEMPCPMQGGKIMPFKQVLTINDDGTHQFEMYGPGPDGKEFNNMTIKYTPAK